MISQKEFFPVDIFAIKRHGIERWQKEFFWPVSDKEFLSLYVDIEQCLTRHINRNTEEIGELFLIQRHLLIEYLLFLHALQVIGRLKDEGKEILYSEKALWYKDVMKGAPIRDNIPNLRRTKYGLYDYSFSKRLETKAKKLLKNFIYNPNLFKFLRSKSQETVKACGSACPLMREYIKRSPYRVYYTSQDDWLPKELHCEIPQKKEDAIKEVSKVLLYELRLIADKEKIRLFDNYAEYLRELTESELIDGAKILHLAKKRIEKSGEIHLLIHNLENPFHKVASIAVRQMGGKVTSFSHGGHIGLCDTPTLASSEFALTDEFITYSAGSVELFERIKKMHTPLKNNRVIIGSGDNYEYFNLWKEYSHKPLPKRIKRVMIVGYPQNQWRPYQASASLALMHLDLELRIVRLLKRAGYEILYKVHPERILEVKGIFDGMAEILWKRPFEDYLDIADAYLFGNIKTTAFSNALCTNKPIIAFRIDNEAFKPFFDAMQALRKRCNFIAAKFDERNRIIFDEKELLNALAQKCKQPNNEFIETYMFP